VISVARVKWREVIESFVLLFVHFFFLYMYGDNLGGAAVEDVTVQQGGRASIRRLSASFSVK
jgi:hypothetical protein